MKNKLKIIINIVIFTIIICASAVYAENEIVENTTNTTNTTTTNTTANTVTNTTNENTNTENTTNTTGRNETSTNTAIKEEKKKSSNANLKNLGIKPNDFKGFKAETTTYKAEVPNNVSKVEVYAEAEDKEAEVIITGTGKRDLKVGENEIIITVTAEDGTQKTYTIYVTRLEKNLLEENSNDKKDNKIEVVNNNYGEENGLANITFGNATLETEFQTNVYEYQVKYIGEETALDITAEPTDSSYIVQITGNENLEEGENLITILVSDKDDNNVATYQLTVNKKLVDEEAIAREKEAQKKALIIGGVIAIVLITVVVIIIKIRKNKKEAEQYEIPFAKMSFDEDKKELLEEKEMSKEEIRKNYLENYNNEYEDAQEEKKKIKSKGKRFK